MKNTVHISIRLDSEILDWFRLRGGKYQTKIRQVLKDYVLERRNQEQRNIGRAQEIFKRYYARCFWHYDPNLIIDSSNISLVIEGLRIYGGREGYLLAEELCQ